MNKISVLAKNKQTYFLKRLTEEVGRERLNLFDPWSDSWDFDPGSLVLCRSTGVYQGQKDLDFLREKAAGARIINPLKSLSVFRSKKTQYSFFKEAGIPHLPWLDLKECPKTLIQEFLTLVPSPRYLIKPHYGQGGWGIRAMNPEELLHWFAETDDREYVLQPYQDQAKELRYFFINGGWSSTLERFRSSGAAAANFQANGQARQVPTPSGLPVIIRGVNSDIPLHYGAMDVLVVGDEFKVLEINVVPGIEQLEALTGHNVIKSLIHSFKIN